MSRAVPEWIGATADTKIPDRVKLRIWDREGGICYLTGRNLQAGEYDFEHVTPLALWTGDGHGNRESNLRLAYRPAHREKTKQDRKVQAKSDRIRKKHLGIQQPKSKWPSRPLGTGRKQHTATREIVRKSERTDA
jgi:hypothetical protein